MKQFVCVSLMLFATAVMAHPHGYSSGSSSYSGSSASVHQTSLADLSKIVDIAAIEKHLHAPSNSHYGSHAASYSPAQYIAPAAASVPGPVFSKSYSAAPSSYASHDSYSAPATYSSPSIASYAAPTTNYKYASKSHGYGSHSAPKFVQLPAYVTQINPGKNQYKTYQTPIQYNTVTLPIAPAGPVANLYAYEGYGESSSHYGGSQKSYAGQSY